MRSFVKKKREGREERFGQRFVHLICFVLYRNVVQQNTRQECDPIATFQDNFFEAQFALWVLRLKTNVVEGHGQGIRLRELSMN